MDRKPSWGSFPCPGPCPRQLVRGRAGHRHWAGLESGSPSSPKPLTLLSWHDSLSLNLRNPEYIFEWWINSWALKSLALSVIVSLACDCECHSKENCSVDDSLGLVSLLTVLTYGTQFVKWGVLSCATESSSPLSPGGGTRWVMMLWVQPSAVQWQGRNGCG